MAQPTPTIWKQKFTTLFKRFDKGDKGCVTKEDIHAQITAFQTQGFLTSQESEEMKVVYQKLWKIFFNGRESVKIDEWIAGHSFLIEANGSKVNIWEETLKPAGSLMFKVADKEKKGVISQEEFGVYLQCLGVDANQYAKHIFSKIDTEGKGELKESQFLDAFYDFNYSKEDTPAKELMGPLVC